jgi:hypothetical protein
MSSVIAACLASLVAGGKAAPGGAGQDAVKIRNMRLLVLAAAVFYVGSYAPHSAHSSVQVVGDSKGAHYSLAYRLTLLTLIGELLSILSSDVLSLVNVLYAAAGLVSLVGVMSTVGLFCQVLVARLGGVGSALTFC